MMPFIESFDIFANVAIGTFLGLTLLFFWLRHQGYWLMNYAAVEKDEWRDLALQSSNQMQDFGQMMQSHYSTPFKEQVRCDSNLYLHLAGQGLVTYDSLRTNYLMYDKERIEPLMPQSAGHCHYCGTRGDGYSCQSCGAPRH